MGLGICHHVHIIKEIQHGVKDRIETVKDGTDIVEIHYKEKDIAEVLDMTVSEAIVFFKNIPAIYNKLKTLNNVGLGYLKLGQSATTLSGGSAGVCFHNTVCIIN
jgi:hypothetical protein